MNATLKVLSQMTNSGTYAGKYYKVHSCVRDFFIANEDVSGFLAISRLLVNFCMDEDGIVHANHCPEMSSKKKSPIHVEPVVPVEIVWTEDKVANELNYRNRETNEGGE